MVVVVDTDGDIDPGSCSFAYGIHHEPALELRLGG